MIIAFAPKIYWVTSLAFVDNRQAILYSSSRMKRPARLREGIGEGI